MWFSPLIAPVKALCVAIKAKTDNLKSSWNDPSAAANADAVWDEVIGDHQLVTTVGKHLYNIDTYVSYIRSTMASWPNGLKIIQKATSPAWDQDTDSLEAIREAIDGAPAKTAITGASIVEDTATGTPKLVEPDSSATANTFGAWVELDAALSADSWICSIIIVNADNRGTTSVCELGVGAATSEVTKVRFSYRMDEITAAGHVIPFQFVIPIPIKVASGTRVAIRVSDDDAVAQTYVVSAQYYQGL